LSSIDYKNLQNNTNQDKNKKDSLQKQQNTIPKYLTFNSNWQQDKLKKQYLLTWELD